MTPETSMSQTALSSPDSQPSAQPATQPARGGVFRMSELPSYSPANHAGTVNTRLIGPHNGAKQMEVLIGEFERSGSAVPHAHPGLEQAIYMLEGEAVTGIDGVEHAVRAGDMVFLPEGVFHSFRVTSERVKVMVIYAPPYGEDPAKVIR
jgi:quercetin dioxygenase-like cupin family protein